MEDYKCELVGGGSPRYLNTFLNLFIVAVHYTQSNTCYVLLLLLLYTTHMAIYAMHCFYCCCALHTATHAMYSCYCCCALHT